jgi:lipopolysaccharide transport system permease protein
MRSGRGEVRDHRMRGQVTRTDERKTRQSAVLRVVRLVWDYRMVLYTTTRAELAKKYAGSFLGLFWIVLYPACFLAIYTFLYLVIFKVRLPQFSEFGFVLFVFSGLVPYLAFMEVATGSAAAIKQNMHYVKNVMFPLDLVPVRLVAMAIVGELIGLCILTAILAAAGSLSIHLPLLVVALFLQTLFFLGIAWLLSALGVLLPDLPNFIGLLTLFLLFISPIGFEPSMVPAEMSWVLLANPIAYMMDVLRSAMVAGYPVKLWSWAGFAGISAATFLAGLLFFQRFKDFIVDYE